MQMTCRHILATLLIVLVCHSADAKETKPLKGKSNPGSSAVEPANFRATDEPAAIEWLADYGVAMKQAERGRKMLLVYFYSEEPTANQRLLEEQAFGNADVQSKLRKSYVAVRLHLNYEVSIGGEKSQLLDHAAFGELGNRPGLVVIDFAHNAEDYHGYIVSLLPLTNGKYYRFHPSYVQTTLELPAGTLTQRTMIFAVRIHPESPRSTTGRPDNVLFDEAREHSRHQARIRVQGHHNWGQRFQRIAQLLGSGLRPKEVVAESWPGEGLVDAAVDCVDSWRQSSGHWGAVRATQVRYGYDIKKGENGIWYATGLFGDHRD